MKLRVFILLLVLFFRIILGWIETLPLKDGRKIRLNGNVIKTFQNTTFCIIKISRFVLTVENICAIKIGDRISVVGNIDRRVIDVFDGEIWLRDAEIESTDKIQAFDNDRRPVIVSVDNFRDFLVERLKKFVPEPEAGLILGIVLGYKNDIRQNLYQEMIRSGTVHIAVASGYNIMLVGGTMMTIFFNFLKRKPATIAAIAGMIFYALMAGAEPPVIRASWMAGILYIGKSVGRGRATVWPLLLTVWIMLMADPALLGSVSFQLSVAASVGILVFEPWISGHLERWVGHNLAGFLSGSGMTTTFATMVTTMPFLWWHFGRVSLIGMVSNVLILPLVPLLMVLGTGVLLWPALFWVPAYVVAHFIVGVIGFWGG